MFIIPVSYTHLDVYKRQDLCKYAKGVKDMLVGAEMPDVRVSLGTIVGEIKDVSRSYKEAKMTLDVGRIFYSDRTVVAYSNLGIGRLIYQLPIPLCKMFIKEIFDGKSPDDFCLLYTSRCV